MLGVSRTTILRALRGGVSQIALTAAVTAGAIGAAYAADTPAPAATPTAAAPQAAAPEGQLETITVTAEMRKGNLQTTPIAITAVTAQMLEARSQNNVQEIAGQAPNVTLKPAGAAFGSSLVAFIRGVGQTDFNYSTEPGVGMYVDDVYYATITGNLLDLLDLDRVEVLRGPQGTLAGRNSIGGAIKLFTKQPNGEGGGWVEGTYGDFNRVDFRGGGDFAVADNLFVRFTGVSRTRDGYVDRIDYACEHNSPGLGQPGGIASFQTLSGCKLGTEGGQSYTGGRVAVKWIANDKVDVNLAFDMVNDKSEVQAGVLVAAPAGANAAGNNSPVPIYYDNNGNGTFDAGIDVPYDSRFVTGGTYKSYSTFIDDGKSAPDSAFAPSQWGPHTLSVPPINFFNSWGTSAVINWQIAENVALKSISAVRYYTNTFAEDTGGSPLTSQLLLQRLKHHQYSQELRLSGNSFSGFADWVVGGFYMKQSGSEDASVDLPFAGLDFIHGPDSTPSTSYAGFGDVIFHPFQPISIALGTRYSHDEKSYTFNRHTPNGLQDPGGLPAPQDPEACTLPAPGFIAGQPTNCSVAGLTGLTSSFASNRWDYRAALNYQVTSDIMAYVQTSTGYKGGGVNARPFYPAQLHSFDPETITSYETGLKTTLFDMMRFNTAAFYNIYKGIQLAPSFCTWAGPGPVGPFPPYFPCAGQDNIGDAHVWGVEAETEIHPTEAFELDASYSYINFEYQRILDPTSPITLDMITPYTPTTKYSVGAQYEISLGDMGTITPRADYTFQSSIYTQSLNSDFSKIDSYGLTNFRLTWRDMDDSWSAAFEVTNVFDKYYYLTLFDNVESGGNQVDGQPGHPREWAITLKKKF